MTREEIQRLVTQVAGNAMYAGGTMSTDAPRLLFLCKDRCPLPERLAEGHEICGLEDYETHQDIARYNCVVIGHLSTAQLADLALARITDSTTCAILHALLNGTDVWLLDGALSFQKYRGKGSPALYQQLNEYVHKLQIYGIKLYIERGVRQVEIAGAPARTAPEQTVSYRPPRAESIVQVGSARPNAANLITEADAVTLIAALAPGEDCIRLDRGAILTPAARDVFVRHRIEVF